MEEMQFSFLFFSDIEKNNSDSERYNFMKNIVTFADSESFTAVYFPERHFHEFGSVYANPAILAAWLIPQTKKIRFRTAGISLPLHHPAEVVEWWSMNDVLSNGRVDLGFGSGWNKADFILSPNNFVDRKDHLHQMIEQVKQLWRGEKVSFIGPHQEKFEIQTFPRPIQSELNVWLLVTQNDDAFKFAGKAGYNIFTMLYGYDLVELKRKVGIYRQARVDVGLDPARGTVTLMMHALVMHDMDSVINKVAIPLKSYIRSSSIAHLNARSNKEQLNLDEAATEKIVEYAFHRYVKTSALLGDIRHCRNVLEKTHEAGVDEVALLVDFGVDYSTVINSLIELKKLVDEIKLGSVECRQ